MSVLFQLIEEDIILKIMEQLHPSQWKLMSRNGLKDNLLHHFINENYILAIRHLLSRTEEEIFELCFQQNAAGNYPIMTIVTQGMEETAQQLWKFMIKSTEKEVCEDSVPHETNKIENTNLKLKKCEELMSEDTISGKVAKSIEIVDYEKENVSRFKTLSLEEILTHKNMRRNTLMHLCAENRQNSLLLEICQTKMIPEEVIQKALTEYK